MGDYSREEIVRRQLGVATQLHLDDLDPISVHCLVSSAAENASLLAKNATGSTFNDHILSTFPDRKLDHIRKLRNQYWTPIKHSKDNDGNPFNHSISLEGFSDLTNDHALFVVWYDYSHAGLPLPLEVQVFQVWYYGLYPEKLCDDAGYRVAQKIFGAMEGLTRSEQKLRLRRGIRESLGDLNISRDSRTDPRPLVLPR